MSDISIKMILKCISILSDKFSKRVLKVVFVCLTSEIEH